MKGILDSWFETYKLRVHRYLENPDSMDLSKLVEQIKAAAFMNEITDRESEYLLDMLPVDINEEIDDGYQPEEVTRKSGGIKMKDIGKNPGIRKIKHDELDDFEEKKEEKQSGFGNLKGYKKKEKVHDDLDDFEEEEEEEEETGFGSLRGYSRKKDEYDDYDDYEEEEEGEEEESGFYKFGSHPKKNKKDEYDELDDFDEDEDEEEEDNSRSGFLGLL